jgi:hypothetical protein
MAEAFDPTNPLSRPTREQQAAFEGLRDKLRSWIFGGNQCLAKGTLVRTSRGPTPIEDIKPGDTVFSENNFPIKVLKVFANGVKEVADIVVDGEVEASCTGDHRWYGISNSGDLGEIAARDVNNSLLFEYTTDDSLITHPATWGTNRRKVETYDIHVDSPTNLYQLANGLVTHNSGKSMWGGRVASWFFMRNCPYIDIDALWPGDPMLILVVGRTSAQTEELWEKKIKPFLEPGSYKEIRVGGSLSAVQHTKLGSTLRFFSHHSPDEAREKLQSFVAHLFWLDELTDSMPLVEESQRRVQAKRGRFIATFTPKLRAEKVKAYIESPSELAQKCYFRMLDNPLYKGREQELLEDISKLPQATQDTILEGAWYVGEDAVYNYVRDQHQELPEGYSYGWRHCEIVDPAASGKVGFMLAAESPRTMRWYIVRAKYLPGDAATVLLDKIEEETKGLNITHRIADGHEQWFLKEANSRRRVYNTPVKDGRKVEMIKGPTQAFIDGWLKLGTHEMDALEGELSSYRWSESVENKIVNSSKYHLIDCLQYFVDLRPKPDPDQKWAGLTPVQVHYTMLREADRARRKAEARAKNKSTIQRRSNQWRR